MIAVAREKVTIIFSERTERRFATGFACSMGKMLKCQRNAEIKLAQAQQKELATALQQSRLRLNSLRLIWKGSPEELK